MRREIKFVLAVMFLAYLPIVGSRVVYSLLALELGASAFDVGILAAGTQLPMVLFSIPVLLLVDRLGARWLLLAGALCGALGLLLPYFFPTLPALLAGSLFFGLWNVLAFQPTQKLVGALSSPEKTARHFSVYAFFAAASLFAGPFIAGISIDYAGPVRALLVLLPFVLIGALMLALWGGMLSAAEVGRERLPRLGDTLADPEVWRLIVISSVISIAVELYPFFMPLYGHAAGLSASLIGTIVSMSAVGGLVLPLALARLVARAGEERVLAWSLAVIALAFAIVPLGANTVVLLAVTLVFGFASAASNPVTAMLAYGRLPLERAGQFLGVRNMGNGTARAVAPPLFGALAGLLGLPGVFIATAVLMGAAGAWVAGSRRGPRGRAQP